MDKEIIDRIKDLAECFKGKGVPNIAYVEAGILELDKLVSSSNVIRDVSDYRLLEEWEMIQRLDEYTLDGMNWKPVEEWDIGQEYDPHNYKPLRRKK